MENRSGTPFCPPKRPLHSLSLFYLLICIFLLAAGCGAPGEPQPPTPPVPQAIADLTAKQAGDGVLLTFTMPGNSTLGERLQQVPTLEILRGTALHPEGDRANAYFPGRATFGSAGIPRVSRRIGPRNGGPRRERSPASEVEIPPASAWNHNYDRLSRLRVRLWENLRLPCAQRNRLARRCA